MKNLVDELTDIPKKVFGVDDVKVSVIRKFNSEVWGYYYFNKKTIELFVLDEDGEIYSDELLKKALCHELAHHLQYGIKIPGVNQEHNVLFKKIYKQLMTTLCEGRIPPDIKNLVVEEGDWIDR